MSASPVAGDTCPNCGADLPAAARFCPACGAQVNAGSTVQAEVPSHETGPVPVSLQRSEPRRERALGQDVEVELVRRAVRRVDERIRTAKHRLLRPWRCGEREARELSGNERYGGRCHLQREQPLGPLPLADDLALDPFAHRLTMTRGNMRPLCQPPNRRSSPAPASTCAGRSLPTRPLSWLQSGPAHVCIETGFRHLRRRPVSART